MLFRFARGRQGPPKLPYRYSEDPIRPDAARLAAWALALGQPRPYGDEPVRRRHRGQLPDVDLSRAVPAPRGPGWATRLLRMVTRSRHGQPHTPTQACQERKGGSRQFGPADLIVRGRHENWIGGDDGNVLQHEAPPRKRGVAFSLFI